MAFVAAAVEKDPEQMNEMIGGKNRHTSRSRSPSHYKVINADDKKVSLIARTPRAIPFMLLTIASRQMFTARAPPRRRWSFRRNEPGELEPRTETIVSRNKWR